MLNYLNTSDMYLKTMCRAVTYTLKKVNYFQMCCTAATPQNGPLHYEIESFSKLLDLSSADL